MNRSRALIIALLVLVLALTACQPSAIPTTTQPLMPTVEPTTQAASGSITLTDALGNELTLEAPAQRIISLAPSNTEILFAVGAAPQVIAREDFSNYPEEAASLPSVGGNMGNYNLEEVVRLNPDLILASPLTAAEQIASLKEVAPNVYVLPNPQSMEELFQNLITVGKLTGRDAEANALVNDLRPRVQAVEEKVATATKRPKVFYELDATDPAKPWTAGPGTFIDLLISMAGGENIGAALTGDYAQISQEELIVQNPDVILLGDSLYGGITPEMVAARPGWDVIQAVENGRVLIFNDDLVSRPGPRMVDGLEELAKAIHPDLFE